MTMFWITGIILLLHAWWSHTATDKIIEFVRDPKLARRLVRNSFNPNFPIYIALAAAQLYPELWWVSGGLRTVAIALWAHAWIAVRDACRPAIGESSGA